MNFRDLGRQYEALREEIDAAVRGVLESSAFINGAPVRELESELASYVGVSHCVTCGNGTDALTLALRALGVGSGDAVFVPDFTFFASAEVVAAVGATPVFVDVHESTFNLSVSSLQEAYDEVVRRGELRPRAIIPVDLFGLPAAYPEIQNFARGHSLHVVEDAAQGFGGAIEGQRACSFGDISATSFFPAKPLGCYGDGGAVFTNDAQWASLMESLKVHGKGEDKYDNERIGCNSRLDTLQAAILRVKLRAFVERENEAMQRISLLYADMLDGVVGVPLVPEGYCSSWAQYTVRLPNEEVRSALQTHLKAHGIPTMVYYPRPMHMQKAFSYLRVSETACPATRRLCSTVLSLPMHPYMTSEEVETVSREVKSFFKSLR